MNLIRFMLKAATLVAPVATRAAGRSRDNRTRPAGPAKQSIDWTLSDAGQAIVTHVGYFPIR